MTDYVLQTEDVAIHYGGVKAVDGVAMTLERGAPDNLSLVIIRVA